MPKPNYSSSGFSGEDRRVYEDGVQRKVSKKTLEELNRTHGGNILYAKRPGKTATNLGQPLTETVPEARTEIVNQIIGHDVRSTHRH